MEPENLTVRVLIEIRDEMRGTRGDIVEVKGEIVAIKDELVNRDERVAAVETTMEDFAGQVRFIGRSMGVLRASRRP